MKERQTCQLTAVTDVVSAAHDHPTAEPDGDEYGKVPTPDGPYAPGGEDEPPPDERDD